MDAPPVYLAGFDVFRRDAIEQGRTLKRLCAEQGLQGLYPFDNQIPDNLSPTRAAALICQQNIAMIRRSHAVLANLNLFRGLEPDSGTVFEIGMAVALGKPVWVYFEPVDSLRDLVPHDAEGFDANGYQVEDFTLPRNLMLACTWAGSSANAEHAISELSAYLQSHVSEEQHRG